MNKFLLGLTISSLLLLPACSNWNALNWTSKSNHEVDLNESVSPPTFIIKGNVVIGGGTQTLTPCNSEQQFWLVLGEQEKKEALSLVRHAYQPMYGEMVGHLQAPAQVGNDADFTARFVVDYINILTTENPQRCQLIRHSGKALGHEPSWSETLKKDDLSSKRETIRPEPNDDSQVYQLSNGKLYLDRKLCRDTMSDTIYGWSAQLNQSKQNYSGCALFPNQDLGMKWIGEYRAQDARSQHLSIRLELRDDHSAVTSYDYSDGSPSMIEKGFWQPLNDDQVQVTMTRIQSQYLVSERIFTRSGDKITTQQEKVNGVVYTIADGGLTLFQD